MDTKEIIRIFEELIDGVKHLEYQLKKLTGTSNKQRWQTSKEPLVQKMYVEYRQKKSELKRFNDKVWSDV